VKSRLVVRFEGDVPGLAESRLSLTIFGKSLRLLVFALRRIGSDLIRPPQRQSRALGRPGGRYAELAEGLDLELVALQPGSVGLEFECSFTLPDGLDADLYAEHYKHEAVALLVDAIGEESRGRNGRPVVRNYLESLPIGARQDYRLFRGDEEVRHVVVERPTLAPSPISLPFLRKLTGNITGVLFSRPQIRIGTGFVDVWVDTTEEQRERALALRHEGITAMVLVDPEYTRLLWLREADDPLPDLPPDERIQAIFDQWDGLLRKLAQ
jgi:hypothetical protein